MRKTRKFAFFSLFFSVLLLCILFFLRTSAEKPEQDFKTGPMPELILSTYQSWVGEEGLGSLVIPVFEKRFQCKIRVMTSPDGGSLLSRLEMDFRRSQSKKPHVVVGIDQYLWPRAQSYSEGWKDWRPFGYSDLTSQYRIDGFLPYSVGTLTFLADSHVLNSRHVPTPHSLLDLLRPELSRQLILEDPRTSTPGLVFILYSFTVLGEAQAFSFWHKLRDQWLTLPQSWDAAYSMFLRQQAPLVWSYFSSQAFHQSQGQAQYQALVFTEGHPIQIEGAFLVRDSWSSMREKELAQKFLEYLLSPEVQGKVPQKNWMFPVRNDVALPSSFQGIPNPLSVPTVSLPLDQKSIQRVLVLWREAVGAGR